MAACCHPELSHLFHDYSWLLNWIPRTVGYIGKKYGDRKAGRREDIENKILDYLNHKSESSSVHFVWAEVFLAPTIEGIPLSIPYPPHLEGVARFWHELKGLPYEVRRRWRVMNSLVPEKDVEKVLTKLLRESRVRFDTLNKRYFRAE